MESLPGLSDRYPGIIEDFQYKTLRCVLAELAVSACGDGPGCEAVAVAVPFDLPHAAIDMVNKAPISMIISGHRCLSEFII
jgi:hypothetical protein